MRPSLRPGVSVWWRRIDAVQLRVGTQSQLVSGLPLGSSTLFRLLDGTHELRDLATIVHASTGLERQRVLDIVESLGRIGALYDAGAMPRLDTLPPIARERLRAEALSWVEGTDAAAVVEKRRLALVRVLTCDAATVATALLLAASGIGRFSVTAAPHEAELVEAADIWPGGLPAASLGTPRVDAVRSALTELGAQLQPRQSRGRADFALVGRADSAAAPEHLLTPDIPYVSTAVFGRTALVGPLVIPGITACSVCEALTRAERDAALDHDATDSGLAPAGTPVAAATATQLAAVHAAVAVLEYLDGAEAGRLPALAGHLLQLDVPGPQVQLSLVRPHPRCGCCWDAA
jgi:bacteriocin biosynthesis cyclodehydratase domain-containing protein